MEDKRKMILLAVAGVCIVGAGVLLYFNLMTDSGPKPVPPPPLEEMLKDPEVKKAYDKNIEIQQKAEKEGRKPAGS
jgi:hypothetical protein